MKRTFILSYDHGHVYLLYTITLLNTQIYVAPVFIFFFGTLAKAPAYP